MLKNLRETETLPEIQVKNITGNPLFRQGLEYSSPARGTWTIAHVPMLIPHSHEIFIGCGGCMRGVVLSAAEFGGLDRFSMITIKDENLSSNNMEEIITEGITDILEKLPSLPPCVVYFTSCIHEFMYCDLQMIKNELQKRFPSVDFIQSAMNPTMRKSGITPEELMRRQLYAPLELCGKNQKSVNIVGNVYARADSSEIVKFLTDAGYTVRDVCNCKDYNEYKQMARSAVNIYTIPIMKQGAESLEKRLNQKAVYMETSFNYNRIKINIKKLADFFNVPEINTEALEQKADEALAHAESIIGKTPVAIDYAAVSQPMQLAQLLIEHDFNVVKIYLDQIQPGDEEALAWLQKNKPELPVQSAVNFQCRFVPRAAQNVIAVGQKAAYFNGTNHFVNIIENGNLWGFDGICRLAALMEEAALHEKDMRSVIQVKAWGCRG